MTLIQLTPAQRLALNGFLSLLASAVVATLSAVYQYYSAGNVSISALLNFALLTFFVIFGKSLHDHVPSHALDAIQSAQDAAQKAQETVRAITANIVPAGRQSQETTGTSSAQPTPLVMIHMAPGSSLAPSTPMPDTADQVATETLV